MRLSGKHMLHAASRAASTFAPRGAEEIRAFVFALAITAINNMIGSQAFALLFVGFIAGIGLAPLVRNAYRNGNRQRSADNPPGNGKHHPGRPQSRPSCSPF